MIESLFASLVSLVSDVPGTSTKADECSPRSDDTSASTVAEVTISRASSVCSADCEADRIYSRQVLLAARGRCRRADTPQPEHSRIVLTDIAATGAPRRALMVQEPEPSAANQDTLPPCSPTSWSMTAARTRRRKDASDLDAHDDLTKRSVKSILNKLTADNFQTLVVKLEQCGLKTTAELEMLVQAIFEDASQRNHSGIYADLCACLVSASGNVRYCFVLRRLLREHCLQRFEELLKFCGENDAATPKTIGDEESDLEEAKATQKIRLLGSVRFMGELLVRSVIRSVELMNCLDTLSSSRVSPGRLEALVALLTVVGPAFDNAMYPQFSPLNDTFFRIHELAVDEAVPKRIRCLLQDVLDLRYAYWVDLKQNQTWVFA